MRSIHQLVHTLSYGDAISSEVLTLKRLFRSFGIDSDIFAINVHPFYKNEARKYHELPSDFQGEAVLHYSLGSPLNETYRRLSRAKRSLIYHNLTPAKWFEGVNPRVASDISSGLSELPSLCRESDTLIADSTFNTSELNALGFSAEVLPLPIDPEKWNAPRNPGIFSLVSGTGGINVLHVGRLAPNKCIEDIIKAFYFLHYHGERNSRLWLVGIDTDTELYSFALKRLAHELKISDAVNFVGRLSDSEVRSLYEASTVYMCMSEHEGFCLPVIEAMHFGLPVIAYSSSALPETVGDGGILVSKKSHPELSELMLEIASNSSLREKIVEAGKTRVSELSLEKFEERVKSLFLEARPRAANAQ